MNTGMYMLITNRHLAYCKSYSDVLPTCMQPECSEEKHLLMYTPKMLVGYAEARMMEGCLKMCLFLAKATGQLKPPYEGFFFCIMFF